jgi:uncharacterized protein YndB with AHSA1/START domain
VTDERFGRMSTQDAQPRVEFERVLDAAIDTVWAMLSTEDGLEKWLAPATVDLRFGGTMDIDFGEGGVAGGEIIELVPGVALEYHWRFTGEPDSVVRFELEMVDPNTTRLRLHHRMLPPDQAVGYSAGWHAHLDQLEAALAGSPHVDWMERFTAVKAEYESQAG